MRKLPSVFSKCVTTFCAVVLLSAGACRFKTPSIKEQQELASRGAFANGAPPWVARTSPIGKLKGSYDFGLIPQDFSSPVSPSTQLVNLPLERTKNIEEQKVALREQQVGSMRSAQEVDPKDELAGKAPLEAISQLCPGLEARVSDAITTTEADERLQKLSSLSARCPESADIWYWLGRDYARQGRLSESLRALDRALLASPSHAKAKELSQHLKEQQAPSPE